MKDFSGYEGISFWARQGPDSQVGFRVLVGDKYTDDDIAYIMYRDDPDRDDPALRQKLYCERVRECGCLNHRACVAVHMDRDNGGTGAIQNALIPSACRPDLNHLGDTQVMKFCGTPEVINGTVSSNGVSSCNTCVETKCDERWPAFPDDCGESGGNCLNKPAHRQRRPVLRQAVLALHDAQRCLRLLVFRPDEG